MWLFGLKPIELILIQNQKSMRMNVWMKNNQLHRNHQCKTGMFYTTPHPIWCCYKSNCIRNCVDYFLVFVRTYYVQFMHRIQRNKVSVANTYHTLLNSPFACKEGYTTQLHFKEKQESISGKSLLLNRWWHTIPYHTIHTIHNYLCEQNNNNQ